MKKAAKQNLKTAPLVSWLVICICGYHSLFAQTNQCKVTFTSRPPGMVVVIDQVEYTTPRSFQWDEGSEHSIRTDSLQFVTGSTRNVWRRWSNDQALAHSMVVVSDSTVVAQFALQHYLEMYTTFPSPSPMEELEAIDLIPGSGFYLADSTFMISINLGSPAYFFDKWSGTGIGSYTGAGNTAFVTMNEPLIEEARVGNCAYSISSSTTYVGQGGATRSFVVNATPCNWSAISGSQSWIHIQQGSGNGNGPVVFSVDPNPTPSARTGSIQLFSGLGGNVATHTVFQNPAVKLSLSVLLEGPYNTSTGLMHTSLNTRGLLLEKFPGMIIPSNAVDSISVGIRDEITEQRSSFVSVRPAWLLENGTIREFASPQNGYIPFDVPATNYYIVVHHRNHLAIMSSARIGLDGDSAAVYDFTTSQTRAFGSDAMKEVSNGVFAQFAGDVNKTKLISVVDANNIFGELNETGYRDADANMSGIVTVSDANIIFGNLNKSCQVP